MIICHGFYTEPAQGTDGVQESGYAIITEDALHDIVDEEGRDIVKQIETLAEKYPVFQKVVNSSQIEYFRCLMLQDKDGKNVREGDKVKVISLNPDDFSHLDEEELAEVMSMLGKTLQIYEIDGYGQAWVEMEVPSHTDDYKSHSVGLSSHEMELHCEQE